MAGLSRYVKILRLFDEKRSEWTVPDMSGALGVPASTVYRTVREMIAENFLEPATDGFYRLGAYFIEFDRLVRVTDPLFQIGTSLLRDVSAQARVPCVSVLARLYSNTVMCVADVATADGNVRTSYERGRPRPLTRGATSKAILAQLPTRRLNKLLTEQSSAEQGPFARRLTEFRDELAMIRKRGYSITRGEVDKGLVGIAAPVAVPQRALNGSVSLVVAAASLDEALERRLVLLIVSSASLLTEELKNRRSERERAIR